MLTSLLFSNIIGGPLAGILLDTTFFGLHGWRTLFIVEAIPAVIFAFIFAFWMKERPEHASWVTDVEKVYIKAELEKEEQQKQAVKKYTTWQALKDPKVLRLALIYFLWVIGFWGFSFWMPQVLKSLSGWPPSVVAWSIAIPMTAALLVQNILWLHLSEKRNEKRLARCYYIVHGTIGFLATPHSPSPVS